MPTRPGTTLQKTSSDGAHSSLVGGSTADRRMGCAASYQEEARVPAHIKNKSSGYADEGTALHAAMEYIMKENIFEEDLEERVLGRPFGEPPYEMTQKLVDEGILPCMDYIDLLMEDYKDEGEFRFEVETRCEMPGIPGAFGTTDFIFRTDKRSGIIDYKFGAGVQVKAYYTEEDGTKRPNSQLMYYGRAAMHTIPHMFEDRPNWPVELHILQPRIDAEENFSVYNATVGELEIFREKLIKAIDIAQAPNPAHKKGPWCTFASCKTVCPLFTGALLDLTKLGAIKATRPEALNWDEHMHMLLEMAEIGEEIINAIKAQAHTHLENGGNIVDPATGERAWKLVPKRATEKVVDEPGLRAHAMRMGLTHDQVFEPEKVKTPAQLGKALEPLIDVDADGKKLTTKKAREEEARRQLRQFTTTASSGTNLVPFDDRRPEVRATPTLVADYAAKLAKLQQQ
jgi:hypothetical protein